MLTDPERDHIADQIAALFAGLDVSDVAGIMTVQLAMLVTQGSRGPDDAIQFLDEIRDQVEEIVRSIPDEAFPGTGGNGGTSGNGGAPAG